MNVEKLVRENIKKMVPYSSARDEFSGNANIYLDANENAFGSPLPRHYNRYPDPLQSELKARISRLKEISIQNIFLGNGSDEAIDLLLRIFCEPGQDNIIICPPTYGMYEVCAAVNNVIVRKVPLTGEFQPDIQKIKDATDDYTKLIFICSPNNPTGNNMEQVNIDLILKSFNGIVIIDEAYNDYTNQGSYLQFINAYPNLVILQTLSKAWGLAGIRLGMAFAGVPVISLLNKIKYPYNISAPVQELALKALENDKTINAWVETTIEQRKILSSQLTELSFTKKIYPSDANFILVKMNGARAVYEFLLRTGIIVRDRSTVILCDDCLRITIGTPAENIQLMDALKSYSK